MAPNGIESGLESSICCAVTKVKLVLKIQVSK